MSSSTTPPEPLAFDSLAVHAGGSEHFGGAALTPIFRSTVFEVGGDSAPYYQVPYPRLSTTPNHREVQGKVAALEGSELALVTGSGMAAITTSLLGHLRAGDRLLIQDQLYGGTHAFVTHDLQRLGIGVDFFDATQDDGWHDKVVPGKTKVVYVEAMTNPLVRVADHRRVIELARRHGLVSMIDSTFAPPVNFRPIALGYDVVVHSATKYLNGHSDLVAGAICGSKGALGPLVPLLAHLGGMLDPGGCYLLARGLKTLGLRVARQNHNAQALAEFLAPHPAVAKVHYPGLRDHAQHARARELFTGFGGVLSFELRGGVEAADAMIAKLKLAFCGPSLGGIETLITRPVLTSHRAVPAADRKRLGIADGLVRLSVGIEHAADLIADFERALSR